MVDFLINWLFLYFVFKHKLKTTSVPIDFQSITSQSQQKKKKDFPKLCRQERKYTQNHSAVCRLVTVWERWHKQTDKQRLCGVTFCYNNWKGHVAFVGGDLPRPDGATLHTDWHTERLTLERVLGWVRFNHPPVGLVSRDKGLLAFLVLLFLRLSNNSKLVSKLKILNANKP